MSDVGASLQYHVTITAPEVPCMCNSKRAGTYRNATTVYTTYIIYIIIDMRVIRVLKCRLVLRHSDIDKALYMST